MMLLQWLQKATGMPKSIWINFLYSVAKQKRAM
jgi:hypothetical protein